MSWFRFIRYIPVLGSAVLAIVDTVRGSGKLPPPPSLPPEDDEMNRARSDWKKTKP